MKFDGPSVLLVGLMGTGKSTIARQLSARLGLDTLDTDRMIELRTNKSVRDIFAEQGEDGFRDLESQVLVECLERQVPCIIAGAGGVVVREKNRDLINAARHDGRVMVVWLNALPRVLANRTSKGTHRPLLDDDREGTLTRLSDQRAPMYGAVADVIIDVSERSVESTVNLLIDVINEDIAERKQGNG